MEAHGYSHELLIGANAPSRRWAWILWRVFEVLSCALLLILLIPLFLVVALAIKLDSPGPVVFRQSRLGIGRRRFTMNKFRTMSRDADSAPHQAYIAQLITGDEAVAKGDDDDALYKLDADERVTAVGHVLRRWSIDELPQLWNVVRGHMSLVGPRPAIPYELEYYERTWHERFSVKPGLTGLWQVSGRSCLTFKDMVRLDIEYARRRSLRLNVRILARTAGVVLNGKGAA